MKLKTAFFYILILASNFNIYTQSINPCDCSLGVSSKCNLICSTGCMTCGATSYVPRPQGDNLAREMSGWMYYLHAPDGQPCYNSYGSLAATFEYTRSFNSKKIANALFCTDCITFAGSQAPNRTNSDVVADNFGLSPLFYRTLKIEPVIENFIVDLSFYFNLSDLFPGFYVQIYAPITHTKWDLGLCECIPCSSKPTSTVYNFNVGEGTPQITSINDNLLEVFPNNYMDVGVRSRPLDNLREGLAGITFADMTIPWNYGKWSFCPLEKNGVADLDVQIGLNFYESILAHFGIFAKVIVPTGHKPTGKYLFEPIVGNRGHWELGGGLTGHWLLWTSPYDDRSSFGIYFKGNVTHVFKSDEIRSFDFTDNGLLSRYLLLKELTLRSTNTITNLTSLLDEEQAITMPLYNNRLINAINFATRRAEVSIDAKGEGAVMLSYVSQGLGFDIGYNIYGRTKENICIKTDCPCDIDTLFLGIKGTEGVGTQVWTVDPVTNELSSPIIPTSNIGLNSTQSNATIFSPTTVETVDNPRLLRSTSTTLSDNLAALNYNSAASEDLELEYPSVIIANASVPPVVVNCTDLNPNSTATCAQLSQKIFVNFSYRWLDTDWFPHINLGAEIEFDSSDINKNNCRNNLNQWGIWVKGGITY